MTVSDVARLKQFATIRLRRPPGPEEMPALIEEAVRTEILAREAARLGLDRDDPIIKARLAEKLDFLAEDAAPDPSPADVAAWIESHQELYAAPSRIDFQQVAFTVAEYGDAASAEAAAARAIPNPENVKDSSGLRFDYAEFTPQQVIPLFGSDFAASLFGLRVRPEWQGPIRSALGWHLVRVAALVTEPAPSPAQINVAARNDWIDYQRVEARRRFFADLRSRYQVILPTGDER